MTLRSGVRFSWFYSDSLGASPALASLLVGNTSLEDLEMLQESVKVLFWPWDVMEVLGMRLLVLFCVLTPKWGWLGSAACTA